MSGLETRPSGSIHDHHRTIGVIPVCPWDRGRLLSQNLSARERQGRPSTTKHFQSLFNDRILSTRLDSTPRIRRKQRLMAGRSPGS